MVGDGVIRLAADATGTGLLTIGGDINCGCAPSDAPGVVKARSVVFGAGDGGLTFNHTADAYVFAPTLTGAGLVAAIAGTTILTGDSSGFEGLVLVGDLTGPGVARLVVDGVLGGDPVSTGLTGGAVLVEGDGGLAGSGVIKGAVGVGGLSGGGVLEGVSGQTLTMGALFLSDTATMAVTLGKASGTALFDVIGDLHLDGTLEVTGTADFGAGVYRLFDYGGDLTDAGLEIGLTPAGVLASALTLQTAVAGQVNLINAVDVDLLFWDGDVTAGARNGVIDGGDGIWSASGETWTDASGQMAGAYTPNPGFAVFMGAGGAVTVDGADIGVTGMQFAVDGYEVDGDAIELVEALTVVRVGDGTAAGAAMTATIGSALTGDGALVKTDLGTLVLRGANTYSGGTQVRAGTLVWDASSIRGDVRNDGFLVFDQAGDADFGGIVTGSGQTIKRGAGVLTLTGASSTNWRIERGGLVAHAGAFTGDADIASGAGLTLTAESDQTYGGVITGTGVFAKSGADVLTLTGDSSGFGGVTRVLTGRLMVNGALGGGIELSDSATLGGSGGLGMLVVRTGAVVSPGNSIGALNVTGDVLFEADSVYEVEVDPTGAASDLVAAGGTVTIEGGTVRHIGFAGEYSDASTYTIITAAGGVSGRFDGVETDFAFLDASLGYTAGAVTLSLDRNQVVFPALGQTGNERSTGGAIEALGAGTSLYDTVLGLNAFNARSAFAQAAGELHGSLRSTLVENAGWMRQDLLARGSQADLDRSVFWTRAHGAEQRMNADGNAVALNSRSSGLWMGADMGLAPGLRFGLSGGVERAEDDSATRWARAERDGYRLGGWIAGQWGGLGVTAGVAGAWDEVETERTVAFPGFAERLEGAYDARTVQVFAEARWTVQIDAMFALEPFANVARVETTTEGFAETGGAAALTVQKAEQVVILTTLGLGARHDFRGANGLHGALEARAGWRTASGDFASVQTQALAAGASFTVEGLPVEDEVMMLEVGGRLDLNDRLAVHIDWAGQAGDRTKAQRLSAALRLRF